MAVKARKKEEKQVKNQVSMERKTKSQKAKQIRVRIEESLINQLKEEAKIYKISLSSHLNFVLNSFAKKEGKEEVTFEEVISKPEKKEIESRVYFTESEAELLRKHAEINEWSVSKEVRYRTVSSLAKKPKLSGEEFKI